MDFHDLTFLLSQASFCTTFIHIVVEVFRASGLLQVCKLWELGVSKIVFPVKDLAPKTSKATNYYGRQLVQMFG